MNEWGRVCFFGQNDLFTWSMTSQMTAAAALPVVKSPKFGPAWPIEKAPNSTARNVWMVKTERNQVSLFSFYWQFSLPFIAKRSFWIRVRLNKSKRNHKHGHIMAKSYRETEPLCGEKASGGDHHWGNKTLNLKNFKNLRTALKILVYSRFMT